MRDKQKTTFFKDWGWAFASVPCYNSLGTFNDQEAAAFAASFVFTLAVSFTDFTTLSATFFTVSAAAFEEEVEVVVALAVDSAADFAEALTALAEASLAILTVLEAAF